ncbi:MAG: hypothetical protein IPK79_00905 [Vampirovibrionales bacterium]|nr:hypothetical protein [Vampirovibrionales bacterium]
MLNAIRSGRGLPKPPESLIGFLRKNGGLQDQGGELTARIGTRKEQVGLLNDKSGMTLDDATFKAWEAGFLGVGDERPLPDALMEALRRDLGGDPVYRTADLDKVAEMQAVDDVIQALDEAGIDLGKATNDQAMAAITGGKARKLEPKRLREIEIEDRRLGATSAKLSRSLEDADGKLGQLTPRHRRSDH